MISRINNDYFIYINCLVLVMKKRCVYTEVGTSFLCIYHLSLKGEEALDGLQREWKGITSLGIEII
jgi:hypothetical protein